MADHSEIVRLHEEADAADNADGGGCQGGDEPAIVSHASLKREMLIQRIVKRLRKCDLATLEAVACIFEEDRRPHA